MKIRILILLALAAAAIAQAAESKKQAAKPENDNLTATGVRFPMYNEKMEMTSLMFGDTAKVMPNGYVDITNLRMEFYSGGESNRRVAMRVESPHCLYQRERGAAASEREVKIVNDSMVVTGTGFVWENDHQVLKILNDAKVVLKNASTAIDKGVKK